MKICDYSEVNEDNFDVQNGIITKVETKYYNSNHPDIYLVGYGSN